MHALLLLLLSVSQLLINPGAGTRLRPYNTTTKAVDIRVTGIGSDGNADIDCFLYDREGKFLESDTGSNDACLLTLPARAPGRYTVILFNTGTSAGHYVVRAE